MKSKFITVFFLAFALLLSACGKSDADLQKAAETAVKEKAASATVVVKDGVATLTGEVENDAAKAAAEAAAKVDGVTSVKNDLKVKVVPPPAVPDAATKAAVEEALKKKGLNDVTVEATTTEVTIRGTVPKDKLSVAMQTATEVAKRKVNNQVTEK